jgi:hypothetical protein
LNYYAEIHILGKCVSGALVYRIHTFYLILLGSGICLDWRSAVKWYIYQETTQWNNPAQPNHIYIFKDRLSGRSASAVAYLQQGSTQVFKFKQPMKIELKDRTFELLTA